MNKEYVVWGYNKKSRMSGQYAVPKNLINKIQKGTKLFSEHLGSISEIESMGIPKEVIDTGREEDVAYYSGHIVGL